MRVLVVQGDPAEASRLEAGFQEQGYIVDTANTGCGAIEMAHANDVDVMVLARQLPDMSGVDVCRRIRREGLGTPIIMLAAVDDTEATVDALDAGADDYVAKPVDFEELLARVRAMFRRCQPDEGSVLRYDSIELDLANRNVTVDGETVILTPREFALLECLLRNRERVLSRTTLGDRVWGLEHDLENSNVVDVYVSRLRKKIPTDKPLIHTVHGTGYMLASAAPVG